MGKVRDELNLGQLCRERFGSEAVMIGFGTHDGTVAAASDWGEAMQVMTVQPSRPDSVERLFHDSGLGRSLLMLDHNAELQQRLTEERLQRFIGHYAAVELARQFDAYVWFDETQAIQPLAAKAQSGGPDTWPFGL
jgi:erythromycin esterase-like protein